MNPVDVRFDKAETLDSQDCRTVVTQGALPQVEKVSEEQDGVARVQYDEL